MAKGEPFITVNADTEDVPVFSETFLYDRIGKGDARFVLGVAEEYEHLIAALGPRAVKALLDVKPRLAERLGTGEKVFEWLEDAVSDDFIRREDYSPSEVKLAADPAHAVWQMLHDEYRRFYDPPKGMQADRLAAYHALTEALGSHERKQRAKADEDRPALVERSVGVKARRQAERDTHSALLKAARAGEPTDDLVKAYLEARDAR